MPKTKSVRSSQNSKRKYILPPALSVPKNIWQEWLDLLVSKKRFDLKRFKAFLDLHPRESVPQALVRFMLGRLLGEGLPDPVGRPPQEWQNAALDYWVAFEVERSLGRRSHPLLVNRAGGPSLKEKLRAIEMRRKQYEMDISRYPLDSEEISQGEPARTRAFLKERVKRIEEELERHKPTLGQIYSALAKDSLSIFGIKRSARTIRQHYNNYCRNNTSPPPRPRPR